MRLVLYLERVGYSFSPIRVLSDVFHQHLLFEKHFSIRTDNWHPGLSLLTTEVHVGEAQNKSSKVWN